jgi:hypothetical protein
LKYWNSTPASKICFLKIEIHFADASSQTPEHSLLSSRSEQQDHFRGDDRQHITRAREAAEALFRPKRQVIEPSGPETPPLADSSVRKPRVLATALPAPVRHAESGAPVSLNMQVGPFCRLSA